MPDNGTTNIQLQHILSKQGIPCQIISKDELSSNAEGNYILNMANHDRPGTHWVAVQFHKDFVLYFDSFGIIYPEEVKQCANNRKIYFNTKDIQQYYATSCGYFCVAFHLYVNDISTFHKFVDMFSYYTDVNDTILKTLLKNKGVN